LAAKIRAAIPQADVVGTVGRRTSFEVTVNGQQIHSKLKTNSFPNFDEVVEIVKGVDNGASPKEVTTTESAGCNIL